MDDLVEKNLRRLALPNIKLIPLTEVEDSRLLAAKSNRNRGEYCWTLTPFAPKFVLDRVPDAERVTYLDADLFFLDEPRCLLDEFDASGKHVLITEHAYDPQHQKSGHERKYGKYCVQFMTFRRTSEADKIMQWWQERCLEWCYAKVENGKFGDQKYLDFWLELFAEKVHVLRQKERTLAPWNVRFYEKLGRGEIKPVFYHFHGLRIESSNKLLLYSGYRIGKAGKKIYYAYVEAIRSAKLMLAECGADMTYLPRKKTVVNSIKILKHSLMNARETHEF